MPLDGLMEALICPFGRGGICATSDTPTQANSMAKIVLIEMRLIAADETKSLSLSLANRRRRSIGLRIFCRLNRSGSVRLK